MTRMRACQEAERWHTCACWAAMLCLALVVAAGVVRAQEPSSAVPPVPRDPLRLEVPLPTVELAAQEPIEQLPDADPSIEEASTIALPDAEQTALARHPEILEAWAALQAARGRWLQAGLKPNPSVGYAASEIGNDGQAGQQGAYIGQTFVRGGKLGLSQAVASHQIAMRQQDVIAAQQRVLTDARVAFYELLVLQERTTILKRLVELTRQAEATAQQLFEARESPKTDYLQARIELDRMQLDVRTTGQSLGRAQRILAARMGLDELPAARVAGDIETASSSLSWEPLLDEVLATHPELIRALADVERARCAIAREQAEVVPDLDSQGMVQYDDSTGYTVVGVQTGFALPLWNRNQGAISAAWAELRAAQQRVDQVRLDLQARLAETFADYLSAEARVFTYKREILPQAGEARQLIAQAYQQGEVDFLNYLTAQRTYFEASLGYLDALQSYWTARSRVLGLLPPSPAGGTGW